LDHRTARELIPMKKACRNSNPWRIIIIGVILCLASQACFHQARQQEAGDWSSARRVPNLISLPLVYQSYDYTCGVAALQSILYYYGKDLRHDELVKALEPDPIKGTNYKRIGEFARSLGFRVNVLTHMSLEDLQKLIDDRKPVIVLIQAWPDSPVQWRDTWNEGHYAVAAGYDGRNIYFMDPSTFGHYAFIPLPEFLDRWHDMNDQEKLIHFGMVLSREGSTIYNPDIIKRLE
jgi:predicted double-glycine peptidase